MDMDFKIFGMKIISRGGSHAAESRTAVNLDQLVAWGKRSTAITVSDCLKGAAALSVGLLACVWLVAACRADMPAEAKEPIVETVVVEGVAGVSPQPAAEEHAVVTMDQTLALAMGIDAVISSVKGTENASDVTMIMVGNTILNRVEDSRYPDTVDQVLCQPYQFSCFESSGMKWVGRAAKDPVWQQRCLDAAERAMNGERMLSYGVVYVSSAKQGTVEAQLDGLYFCKN
jgi:hypothetical protein